MEEAGGDDRTAGTNIAQQIGHGDGMDDVGLTCGPHLAIVELVGEIKSGRQEIVVATAGLGSLCQALGTLGTQQRIPQPGRQTDPIGFSGVGSGHWVASQGRDHQGRGRQGRGRPIRQRLIGGGGFGNGFKHLVPQCSSMVCKCRRLDRHVWGRRSTRRQPSPNPWRPVPRPPVPPGKSSVSKA